MVSRERLRSQGLRSYELGRLRAASRAAWLLIPVGLFCALWTGAHERCACAGALLLASSIYLRWRDRAGGDSVRRGLQAGALPLAIGLLVARFAPECANAPVLSWCSALSVAFGTPAGLWLGYRLSGAGASLGAWCAGGGVAILAASLGCVGLGIAGLLGVSAGLVLGLLSSNALIRSNG